MEKVIKLLKYFSIYKGPEERGFVNNKQIISYYKADDRFTQLFGGNESITLFKFDNLIESISTYFNWDRVETKNIVSVLTFNLDAQNYPLAWVSKPFIKLNNHVVWLGSFLKDRRWDNILINKLKQDSDGKSLVKTLSRNFELQIQNLFEDVGFKTISGTRFKSSNGQQGDFDLLAFKDNYLFIGEAKSGSRSDDFYHSVYLETIRLEGSAAEQLEKSLFNIKEDWENLQAKLGLDENVKFDEIVIIPLIITDYFEGDLQLYKKKYRKISLLELDVLLRNTKRYLLEFYQLMQQMINRNNPNINRQITHDKKWDIWQGKEYPDLQRVLSNIDNNEIWKEMEVIWKFPDGAFTIE